MSAAANPFRAIHTDAWADPIDVASLNKEVSDFLSDCIEELRAPGDTEPELKPARCVLLLGQAGIGKTHLFARLRKRVGPRAVFVLSRPELGLEPSSRHVLAAIVDSLKMPVLHDEDHRQIDLIVGAAFAGLDARAQARKFPLAVLDDWKRRPAKELDDAISNILDEIERASPRMSVNYIEHLLRLPFAPKPAQRALFTWLSGREPSPAELRRIDEKDGLSDMDVMPALRTLASTALFGIPVVLVFDQLENLCEEVGKAGRISAYGQLVSEMRDTAPGFLIVQMALDTQWYSRIHSALHGSHADRITEHLKHLAMPTPEQRRELIRCWWEKLLPEEEREKPFPHPFLEADVERWVREVGMTPRMLMQTLGEAYLRRSEAKEIQEQESVSPAPEDPRVEQARLDERLRSQWEEMLGAARAEAEQAAKEGRGVDAERLMSGLSAICSVLDWAAKEELDRKPVPVLRISPKDTGTLKELEKIIVVMQQVHPRSFVAALQAATTMARERPTVLLRERTFAVPTSWKESNRLLNAFSKLPGAAYFPVEREDLIQLMALSRFLSAARSQDLSAQDGKAISYEGVMEWVKRTRGISSWAIVSHLEGGVSAVPAPPTRPANTGTKPAVSHEEAREAAQSKQKAANENQGPAGAASDLNKLVRDIVELNGILSVDRLLRETKAQIPDVTHVLVLEEIGKIPAKVLGGSMIVLNALENI